MKIVAECPEMRSDRPGIMPKVLDLENSPHVLEREKDGKKSGYGLVGGEEERDTHI